MVKKEKLTYQIEVTPEELVRLQQALLDARLYNQGISDRCTTNGEAWRVATRRNEEYKELMKKLG